MFTGIVETTGIVTNIAANGSNKVFWIDSPISSQVVVDQSVSHNGVCLTVEETNGASHRATAIAETLQKSNLGSLSIGAVVNLERSLQLSSLVDGHLVQGHIDSTARCIQIHQKDGSWEFEFAFPKKFAPLIIEKGSISVNGISLTAFEVTKKSFKVAVIPYTYNHTNIQFVKKDEYVNIEFDMIGKYILRKLSLKE